MGKQRKQIPRQRLTGQLRVAIFDNYSRKRFMGCIENEPYPDQDAVEVFVDEPVNSNWDKKIVRIYIHGSPIEFTCKVVEVNDKCVTLERV